MFVLNWIFVGSITVVCYWSQCFSYFRLFNSFSYFFSSIYSLISLFRFCIVKCPQFSKKVLFHLFVVLLILPICELLILIFLYIHHVEDLLLMFLYIETLLYYLLHNFSNCTRVFHFLKCLCLVLKINVLLVLCVSVCKWHFPALPLAIVSSLLFLS